MHFQRIAFTQIHSDITEMQAGQMYSLSQISLAAYTTGRKFEISRPTKPNQTRCRFDHNYSDLSLS